MGAAMAAPQSENSRALPMRRLIEDKMISHLIFLMI